MKHILPLLCAAVLLTTTSARAATFSGERLNVSQLENQAAVSLVKAGGNLGLFAHSQEAATSTAFILAEQQLSTVNLGTPNAMPSASVRFNGYMYIKFNDEIWRTPDSSILQWEHVGTVSEHSGPIMKTKNALVVVHTSRKKSWTSSNGTTWTEHSLTGLRRKDQPTPDAFNPVRFNNKTFLATLRDHSDGHAYVHLFRSANGHTWTEVGTSVFGGDTKITDIGALFAWRHTLYMLTTDENGDTQWWESTHGTDFTQSSWDLDADNARVVFKDAEALLLATGEADSAGVEVWQYEDDSEWVLTDIDLNPVVGGADLIEGVLKFKNKTYVLSAYREMESSSSDADFSLFRIQKD